MCEYGYHYMKGLLCIRCGHWLVEILGQEEDLLKRGTLVYKQFYPQL